MEGEMQYKIYGRGGFMSMSKLLQYLCINKSNIIFTVFSNLIGFKGTSYLFYLYLMNSFVINHKIGLF